MTPRDANSSSFNSLPAASLALHLHPHPAEAGMHLSPITSATTTTYRVEVSGWDSSQSFFVEKADLEWSESGEKLIVLRHELREGTILFVRLLQPISPDRSHPVPYTAKSIRAANFSQWEYRLKQALPRAIREETTN